MLVPKKAVLTPHAPQPIGPYSQAVQVGGMLYCSGQIALDPKTSQMVEGDVVVQAQQVMKNIDAVLTAAGTSFENVVKTTIFLKSMADFPRVNEIYGKFFRGVMPARSTVEVSQLPKGALVEVEVIALCE